MVLKCVAFSYGTVLKSLNNGQHSDLKVSSEVTLFLCKTFLLELSIIFTLCSFIHKMPPLIVDSEWSFYFIFMHL